MKKPTNEQQYCDVILACFYFNWWLIEKKDKKKKKQGSLTIILQIQLDIGRTILMLTVRPTNLRVGSSKIWASPSLSSHLKRKSF